MAKDYAKSLYASKAWDRCRSAYLSQHNLCERCLKNNEYVPAKIVHHKVYISPSNINNPDIILSFDNLEALCQTCHNIEHHGSEEAVRHMFDEEGNVLPISPLNCE